MPVDGVGDAADAVRSPREQAIERIARLVPRFPDLGLPEEGADGDAPAPFARALEQEVRRRWLTLVAVIEAALDRGGWPRLEPRVKAVLLAGSAQLLLLEGEPDHAVVDASVGWATRRVRRGAGGLVNAVLRRIAGLRAEVLDRDDPAALEFERHRDLLPWADGRALRLREAVLPESPIERLSVQTSHGLDLLLHWTSAHGFAACRTFAAHGLLMPPLILAGVEALSPEARNAAPIEPHDRPDFAIWKGPIGDLAAWLAAHPGVRVQDPGSAEAVRATANAPGLAEGGRILDLCAGRGTKTRQLAQMHPQAEIVAVEPNETRRRDLEALAGSNPRIRVLPQARLGELGGSVDLAVLDVPCSNTAVLPRRPEARYRFTRGRLDRLVSLQREIAEAALPLLSASGSVLYTTCSLEPVENQRQAEWIARRLGGSIRSIALRTPQGIPGDPPRRYADGGFHVLIQR
jgi:16S rRNA (cytosine967-C5)-methyltransferase